jgi:dTDP-4-amino-4,6-dideoxygalactose transaminase
LALSDKTKAVIVSHLHGCLVDMSRLSEIARPARVAIVEDACQAPGAMLQGRRVGSWGNVGVLSFGGSKLLTAGRGGALLTNDARVLQRAKVFSQRGNDAFPLSELQAAVLLPQIEQLDERNDIRLQNVRRLVAEIGGLEGIQCAEVDTALGTPAYYKLGMMISASVDDASRGELVQALRAEGVDVGEGFRGFHRRGTTRCRQVGSVSAARLAAESTMVLHHPVLLEPPEVINRVIDAFAKVAGSLLSPL